MNKAFEKILERLEEKIKENTNDDMSYKIPYFGLEMAKKIVKEVAEEYSRCDTDILCDECDTYDKEKHYCSKYCPVIRGTLRELKENDNM